MMRIVQKIADCFIIISVPPVFPHHLRSHFKQFLYQKKTCRISNQVESCHLIHNFHPECFLNLLQVINPARVIDEDAHEHGSHR